MAWRSCRETAVQQHLPPGPLFHLPPSSGDQRSVAALPSCSQQGSWKTQMYKKEDLLPCHERLILAHIFTMASCRQIKMWTPQSAVRKRSLSVLSGVLSDVLSSVLWPLMKSEFSSDVFIYIRKGFFCPYTLYFRATW